MTKSLSYPGNESTHLSQLNSGDGSSDHLDEIVNLTTYLNECDNASDGSAVVKDDDSLQSIGDGEELERTIEDAVTDYINNKKQSIQDYIDKIEHDSESHKSSKPSSRCFFSINGKEVHGTYGQDKLMELGSSQHFREMLLKNKNDVDSSQLAKMGQQRLFRWKNKVIDKRYDNQRPAHRYLGFNYSSRVIIPDLTLQPDLQFTCRQKQLLPKQTNNDHHKANDEVVSHKGKIRRFHHKKRANNKTLFYVIGQENGDHYRMDIVRNQDNVLIPLKGTAIKWLKNMRPSKSSDQISLSSSLSTQSSLPKIAGNRLSGQNQSYKSSGNITLTSGSISSPARIVNKSSLSGYPIDSSYKHANKVDLSLDFTKLHISSNEETDSENRHKSKR